MIKMHNPNNINKNKERVDKIIIKKFPNISRQRAQELIMAGRVLLLPPLPTPPKTEENSKTEEIYKRVAKAKKIERPSVSICASDADRIYIVPDQSADFLNNTLDDLHSTPHFFVSRGATKLQAAIDHWHIDPRDCTVVDVGAGTGGFTDYLLSCGAKQCFTLDVGHGQLASKLISDCRVKNFEGVNIKKPFALPNNELVDLAVADLSFISLRKVLKNILSFLKPTGKAIILFKPQFEVGKSLLNKRGVVKSEQFAIEAVLEFSKWFTNNFDSHKVDRTNEITSKENLTSCQARTRQSSIGSFYLIGYIPSPIKGKEGNQEYLLYFASKID